MRSDPLPIVPHNDEAERSLLGGILIAPARIGEVAERVSPDDFFHRLYKKIFETMLRLDDERRPIDAVAIADELADNQELKDAGGIAFLSALADGVYARAPLGEYCGLVKRVAQRRRLQSLVHSIGDQIADRAVGTEHLLERAESEFSALREDYVGVNQPAVHVSQVGRELEPVLDRIGAGKGVMLGTPTGFSDLDHKTCGWIPGEFVVLASRPSGGKTALGLGFTLHQARQGNAVALFSLEMSRASIVLRLACREARVSYHQICVGWLSREDTSRLFAALERVTELPIWIDDRPTMLAHELRWRLRSLARRHVVKLAVVDYLQLLRAKAENRTQEITKISIELKAAARELGEISGGTLLAVSQLSRLAANDRPQLHHLRESGQIEQDADTVLFISDEKPTALGQPNPTTKLLEVAKQRNGPTGVVRLTFLPAVMGFEPATSRTRESDYKMAAAGGDSQ